MTGDEREKPE